MSSKTIRPGLTAATGAVRALHAAGWKVDRVDQLADGSTERALLHPSGREITAITDGGRDSTDLTLTGLTLDQVAGAVTGAGLAPAGPVEVVEPRYMSCPRECGVDVRKHNSSGLVDGRCDTDLRDRLAAELHRIADDIVRLELPLKDTLSSTLNLGVLHSRADLERWAEYLGSAIKVDSANSIPFTTHRILLDGQKYGAWLDVRAQTKAEPQESELERLRAEVAELRAAQGGAR
ncbi:hypothetical protein [Micromonospora sp. NPDC023633]|uniref:hypothetical protein n=1 Tax=Micromonospora sp. NPDC023633 TaxID=3154320 RepID=UPI003404696E